MTSFSFDNYYQANYKIWGKEGVIQTNRAYAVPPDFETKINLQKNNEEQEIKIRPEDHFKIMIDVFSKEILENSSEKDFEKKLLNQAKLMEALRKSNQSKKTIFLDEIN